MQASLLLLVCRSFVLGFFAIFLAAAVGVGGGGGVVVCLG